MKKILGLTVAALCVIGLVGGGTWAYFSDSEESTGNFFSAGTLDLGLDNDPGQSPTGGISATFVASDMAPGGTAGNGSIYVYNAGSIDMSTVNITFSLASYSENTPDTVDNWNATTGTDNLTNMIITTNVKWGGVDIVELENKSIEELIALSATNLGNLNAGVEKALYMEWTFSDTATNGCQGDELDLTIEITGTQN